jgi:hypothetical protein
VDHYIFVNIAIILCKNAALAVAVIPKISRVLIKSTIVEEICMAIKQGQRYLVSSINLGLRFTEAVDLLVTIKDLDSQSDGLELSPGLPSGAFPSDAFFSVVV